MRIARWTGALLPLLIFLMPQGVGATVMLELPLEQMVEQADAIVLARVQRVGSLLSDGPGGVEPHTLVVLGVERWLKGSGPARVTVEELGGTWLHRGMRVDGTPSYRVGEQVLVFLRRMPAPTPTYRTFGMAQGKFTVLPRARPELSVVRRDLSQLSLAYADRHRLRVHKASPDPALQLRSLIDFIVARQSVEAP